MSPHAKLTEMTLDFLRQHGSVLVQSYLSELPDTTIVSPNEARPLPVINVFDGVYVGPDQPWSEVAQFFLQHRARWYWRQTYDLRDFDQNFLDGYGWTELIGPYGFVPSEAVRIAYLALGPNRTYPPHRHQPEEVYIPLVGVAEWQTGDPQTSPFTAKPPGTEIHHPSLVNHATRTKDDALLVLALWRGANLAKKSVVLADM